MAYECSEEFFEKTEFGVKKILEGGKFLIPVVHAEADYFKPLRMGDKIEIKMTLSPLGKSSFALSYAFFNESNELAANVRTVNVMVDTESGKSIEIPEELKKILNSINT